MTEDSTEERYEFRLIVRAPENFIGVTAPILERTLEGLHPALDITVEETDDE